MTDILTASGATKRYSGVTVLDAVDLDLRRGEVHALIGENGAGKSTLIKILSGDILPDEGTIHVDGKPVNFASPADARRSGIVTIFQELAIVPEMTVAENIVLGAEPVIGPGRQIVSRRRANAVATRILAQLLEHGGIDPQQPAYSLSTAEKQIVEIARALALEAPVIIMDEPTASLSGREADALLRIIAQLRDAGKAIVFVSHRLNEVLQVADRITVLRGGQRIDTLAAEGVSAEHLIELMVGRPISELYPARNERLGSVVLRVDDMGRAGAFDAISFEVREGEVLGFAGLVGAGRTELMRAIYAADPFDSGRLTLDGEPVRVSSPRGAIAAGFGLVPEDRKDDGLVLTLTGRENLTLAAPDKVHRRGFVSWSLVNRTTEQLRKLLQIRGSLDIPAARLSGGNQQKIVLGKWVHAASRVLILDEPTRGIDVGAKVEVYRLIHKLAADGAAILLVSSELPELMNVAHRILVMSGGRIQAEFTAEDFDERAILKAAFQAHLGHAPGTSTRDGLPAGGHA